MKKILALLLAMVTVFTLFACSGEPDSNNFKAKDSKPTGSEPEDSNPDDSKDDITDPLDTAVVIDDHNISTTELTYFYIDGINNWYSQYGSYAQYFNLNVSLGLDQQVYDEAAGTTWADFFLEQAVQSAKNVYALRDAAEKAGYSLSAEEQANVDALYTNLEDWAEKSDMSVAEYLQGVYGDSSNEETYKKYYENTVLASAYYSHYAQQLMDSYKPADLREFEKDESYKYNSYTYASYYLSLDSLNLGNLELSKDFLEEAKNALSDNSIDTVDKLNAAIAKMEDSVGVDTHSTATENKKQLYNRVSSLMQEWLRDDGRKNGDITAISYNTDGTLKGYYIVLFQECHDNYIPLANVRHILVAFEGGSYNSATGMTTYSDAEKNAAKAEAERLLQEWQAGAATEDSFADLANKHSDDGDGTTGGLYEDVYPRQMVTNFNDWCFADNRKVGDTGVVETEYGYHVMFYSGDSDQNYRDYMVSSEKLTEDVNTWLEDLLASVTVEEQNLDSIDKDLVLSSGT